MKVVQIYNTNNKDNKKYLSALSVIKIKDIH